MRVLFARPRSAVVDTPFSEQKHQIADWIGVQREYVDGHPVETRAIIRQLDGFEFTTGMRFVHEISAEGVRLIGGVS